MSVNKLKLKVLTDVAGNKNIAARIVRFDDFVYNPKTKVFMAKNQFVDWQSQMIPLIAGTAIDQWEVTAYVDITASQFPDGDYTVYYYDLSVKPIPKPFEWFEYHIFEGSALTQDVPSKQEVAARVMDSQVGETTMRVILANIHSQITDMHDKLVDTGGKPPQ